MQSFHPDDIYRAIMNYSHVHDRAEVVGTRLAAVASNEIGVSALKDNPGTQRVLAAVVRDLAGDAASVADVFPVLQAAWQGL